MPEGIKPEATQNSCLVYDGLQAENSKEWCKAKKKSINLFPNAAGGQGSQRGESNKGK